MELFIFFAVIFVLITIGLACFNIPKHKVKTREERRSEAEEELKKLLAQETDKYFFTVKLKNGKTMKSEIFETKGEVFSVGTSFYKEILSAKKQAERAMTRSVNGFLKIKDVLVKENEIVMKKVVKVREND